MKIKMSCGHYQNWCSCGGKSRLDWLKDFKRRIKYDPSPATLCEDCYWKKVEKDMKKPLKELEADYYALLKMYKKRDIEYKKFQKKIDLYDKMENEFGHKRDNTEGAWEMMGRVQRKLGLQIIE